LGGYGDVSVYSSEPSIIQLWQTLICIRKGSSDYHFMKYDKSSQAWHHKPGGTAPLKVFKMKNARPIRVDNGSKQILL